MLPKALKSCPKFNKSPNLVTLVMKNHIEGRVSLLPTPFLVPAIERLDYFRYYAIVHPLKAQYLCTISKAKKTVMVTWTSAFILATPILWVQV